MSSKATRTVQRKVKATIGAPVRGTKKALENDLKQWRRDHAHQMARGTPGYFTWSSKDGTTYGVELAAYHQAKVQIYAHHGIEHMQRAGSGPDDAVHIPASAKGTPIDPDRLLHYCYQGYTLFARNTAAGQLIPVCHKSNTMLESFEAFRMTKVGAEIIQAAAAQGVRPIPWLSVKVKMQTSLKKKGKKVTGFLFQDNAGVVYITADVANTSKPNDTKVSKIRGLTEVGKMTPNALQRIAQRVFRRATVTMNRAKEWYNNMTPIPQNVNDLFKRRAFLSGFGYIPHTRKGKQVLVLQPFYSKNGSDFYVYKRNAQNKIEEVSTRSLGMNEYVSLTPNGFQQAPAPATPLHRLLNKSPDEFVKELIATDFNNHKSIADKVLGTYGVLSTYGQMISAEMKVRSALKNATPGTYAFSDAQTFDASRLIL